MLKVLRKSPIASRRFLTAFCEQRTSIVGIEWTGFVFRAWNEQ